LNSRLTILKDTPNWNLRVVGYLLALFKLIYVLIYISLPALDTIY
jgi:hypothetical protein